MKKLQLKSLNWSDFDQHKPCYSPQERYGDFSGTILDILKDERVPDDEKIWAFTREGIMDDRTLRLFAVGCARKVQHLMADQRSINALGVAEDYANGLASDEELAAAKKAAWEAWEAARAAAWSAARAAWASAWEAAREAAWSAAWEAARAAAKKAAWEAWEAARASAWAAAREARAAAREAAWEAERKAQVQIAIELINQFYQQ